MVVLPCGSETPALSWLRLRLYSVITLTGQGQICWGYHLSLEQYSSSSFTWGKSRFSILSHVVFLQECFGPLLITIPFQWSLLFLESFTTFSEWGYVFSKQWQAECLCLCPSWCTDLPAPFMHSSYSLCLLFQPTLYPSNRQPGVLVWSLWGIIIMYHLKKWEEAIKKIVAW